MRQKRTQAPSIAAGWRVPWRAGSQGAAASAASCSRRTPARSPAGGGVCGAQLASHAGQVSSGPRRHRRAARVARRPGLQRAAASPARSSRHAGALSAYWRESRYGAALAGWLPQITHARGVGATVGIASAAHGHQCNKGECLVVSQAIRGWLVWVANPVPPPRARSIHRAAPAPAGAGCWPTIAQARSIHQLPPAPVGRCCARPGQCGRWPHAKSGRCRRTGKRAVRGAALAGRRRVVGAFGALVAVVAHYKKCSEWRRTRSPSLALFGVPPLHFLQRTPTATNAPGAAGVRFRVGTVAPNVSAMLRLPTLGRDRAAAPPPPGSTAPTTRRRPASAAPGTARLPVRRQRPDVACGQRPHRHGRAQQRPTGAGAASWSPGIPGGVVGSATPTNQPRIT